MIFVWFCFEIYPKMRNKTKKTRRWLTQKLFWHTEEKNCLFRPNREYFFRFVHQEKKARVFLVHLSFTPQIRIFIWFCFEIYLKMRNKTKKTRRCWLLGRNVKQFLSWSTRNTLFWPLEANVKFWKSWVPGILRKLHFFMKFG